MTFIRTKMRALVLIASLLVAVVVVAERPAQTGVTTANGWYEGEEIYYILLGEEEGVRACTIKHQDGQF